MLSTKSLNTFYKNELIHFQFHFELIDKNSSFPDFIEFDLTNSSISIVGFARNKNKIESHIVSYEDIIQFLNV